MNEINIGMYQQIKDKDNHLDIRGSCKPKLIKFLLLCSNNIDTC